MNDFLKTESFKGNLNTIEFYFWSYEPDDPNTELFVDITVYSWDRRKVFNGTGYSSIEEALEEYYQSVKRLG